MGGLAMTVVPQDAYFCRRRTGTKTMGSRPAGETVIAIITAFIEQSTWRQADLARRVGVTVPTLRRHLEGLSVRIPLEAEKEHPHVLWSVPQRWFPGAVTVLAHDASELLRQLARAPQSAERDRLILTIASATRATVPNGVPADNETGEEEATLRLVEDACRDRVTLAVRYYSAHTGRIGRRTMSVQRVLVGAFHRVVALCHRTQELRFFRISRMHAPVLESETPYVAVPNEEVEAFIDASVDGYRDPVAAVTVAFSVRDPESRWVADTLPIPMRAEPTAGGVRLEGETAGVLSLARFVVGLGEAARAETPQLIAAVHRLARGATITGSAF